MSAHTPGPWRFFVNDPEKWAGFVIEGSTNQNVALTITQGQGADEETANARLIAAAPTMRSALERLLELFDHVESKDPHSPFCNGVHAESGQCEGDYIAAGILDDARAALRAAEGREP